MRHGFLAVQRVFDADAHNRENPAPEGRTTDWTFVTPRQSKGWILDAICREIGARTSGTWQVCYNPKAPLPPSRNYFFSHYWNYLDRLKTQPDILNANVFVWYTHPREIPYTTEERIAGLNRCTQVISACSLFKDMLIGEGLHPSKLRVVLGAADPKLFKPHKRTGAGAVGLSSAYYERKNPDIVRDLVKQMPHRQFVLIGKGWEEYADFATLKSLPNFRYVTASYAEYPALYASMDIFVSAAALEGGPIPLIEAMMCNVVPVASRTGFAPDVIAHEKNGFLFDVGAPAEVIAPLIDKAYALSNDVRQTVEIFSWRTFAREILALGARRGLGQ